MDVYFTAPSDAVGFLDHLAELNTFSCVRGKVTFLDAVVMSHVGMGHVG
jgi:hypothetical protein